MNNYVSREMIFYLFNVLGLDESTIELGIKLSIKNNTPLPILLWSYGMPVSYTHLTLPTTAYV